MLLFYWNVYNILLTYYKMCLVAMTKLVFLNSEFLPPSKIIFLKYLLFLLLVLALITI